MGDWENHFRYRVSFASCIVCRATICFKASLAILVYALILAPIIYLALVHATPMGYVINHKALIFLQHSSLSIPSARSFVYV